MNVVMTQVSEAFEDISRLSNKMELMRNEATETERRRNNIIVCGLPEDSDLSNDQLATEILNAINVEPNFSRTERLGAIRSDGKPRPLRIRLGSSILKDQAVKSAARIRKVDGDFHFNKSMVFIKPDMTKLQRDADIELRKKLAEKRQDDPNSSVDVHDDAKPATVFSFNTDNISVYSRGKEILKSLLFTHFNAQGLTNKFSELSLFLSDSTFGGVAFLVRKALNPTLCSAMRDHAEILWIDLNLSAEHKVTVGVDYRPDKGQGRIRCDEQNL